MMNNEQTATCVN